MTRDDAIHEATAILARCYSAERIYPIGSSARGEAKLGSDLDFVVVVPDDAPNDLLWSAGAQQQLWQVPFAIDIVPFRHSTFERRSSWLMSLPAIALREGRLVYEAGQPTA